MAQAAPRPPDERPESKSAAELIRQIVQDTSRLIQEEFQLLREELSNTVQRTGVAVALVAAGAFFLIFAIGYLGFALIVLLSALITPWISAALVGLAFLAVGAIVIYMGINRFRSIQTAPQTVETLKEDAEWLKHPTRPEEK
ncbi:MAG TPA: phage holin family protein [Candidatus Aquicultor sp.]|jgi:TRAP-type C4-dicarboxylate transport system permease small subunit